MLFLEVMPLTFSPGRQLYLYVVPSWLFSMVHFPKDLHVFHCRKIPVGYNPFRCTTGESLNCRDDCSPRLSGSKMGICTDFGCELDAPAASDGNQNNGEATALFTQAVVSSAL